MLAKKSSIITKVIICISIITLCIMPVTASYANMYDWGMYYCKSGSSNNLYENTMGAGGTIQNCTAIVPYWAFDTLESDTTYTLTFSFTTTDGVISKMPNKSPYLTGACYNYSSMPAKFGDGTKFNTATVSRTDDGNKVTFTVKFNTSLINNITYPIYIYIGQNLSSSMSVKTTDWAFYTEYDPDATKYIQQLVEEVANMRTENSNYYSNALQVLDNIKSGLDSTNTKLDEMPQKVEDVLDKQATEEKTEANSTGTDVVNQATEALKNVIPYTSLLDAIQPIKQAASYTGTVSVWTLPSITIPKITGVMEETEIMSEKSFDLVSYADQFIPDTLLSIIRAVNTVGLILFAVYEVIRLILWVVSGDSEGSGIFK